MATTYYIRWNITRIRAGNSYAVVQAGEFNLYDADGNKLSWSGAAVTCDTATKWSGQGPDKLIDGSAKGESNKWAAAALASTSAVECDCSVYFTVSPDTPPAYYSFTTACDDSNRDPVSWTVYTSLNGETWTKQDSHESASALVPTSRSTETEKWAISFAKFRCLLQSGGTYYTIAENADGTGNELQALEITEPSADAFQAYGIEDAAQITAELLSGLGKFTILKWTDGNSITLTARLGVTPPDQPIVAVCDMSHESILGISAIDVTCTDTVGVCLSYDDGFTYSEEQLLSDLPNADLAAIYAALPEDKRLPLRFVLHGEDTLTSTVFTFQNPEEE